MTTEAQNEPKCSLLVIIILADLLYEQNLYLISRTFLYKILNSATEYNM